MRTALGQSYIRDELLRFNFLLSIGYPFCINFKICIPYLLPILLL